MSPFFYASIQIQLIKSEPKFTHDAIHETSTPSVI